MTKIRGRLGLRLAPILGLQKFLVTHPWLLSLCLFLRDRAEVKMKLRDEYYLLEDMTSCKYRIHLFSDIIASGKSSLGGRHLYPYV